MEKKKNKDSTLVTKVNTSNIFSGDKKKKSKDLREIVYYNY